MDKNRYIIYSTLLSFESLNKEIKYILNQQFTENIEGRDRRFITEIVYGTTRQRLNLDWKIKSVYKGIFKNIDKKLLVLLRMSVYQIFFCKNIPDYATVNTSVEISRKINKKYTSICNGILRSIIRNRNTFNTNSLKIDDLSNYYSHPKWLIEKWLKAWTLEDVIKLMKWNNKRPEIWFRFNSKKISTEKFSKEYNPLKKNKYIDNYFTFSNTQSILESDIFKNGILTVQNPTSGIIIELLNIEKQDAILDACAAPGGKSSYIYNKMLKTNTLTCLEINKHRYEILKANFKSIPENLFIKNINFLKYAPKVQFDKILLDVPCIGTGVMSKRSDLRWLKKPKDININKKLHLQMLNKATTLLSKKGAIIYSTCSIEKEDSSYIVNEFLKNNNNFTIESPKKNINDIFIQNDGTLLILPHKHNIDGGYAAKLVRK